MSGNEALYIALAFIIAVLIYTRSLILRNADKALKVSVGSLPKAAISNRDIIADYGDFTERRSFTPTRIEDVSILPHPKGLILQALLEEIRNGHPKQTHEYLKIGAAGLAQYQPNVGPVPLEQLGMDISKSTEMDVEALKREMHLLVEVEKKYAIDSTLSTNWLKPTWR